MIPIFIIIIIIIISFFILRYYCYNNLLVYKSIDTFNENINLDLDQLYHEYNNEKEKHILADYSKINLEDVDNSYNISYIRKFPFSNPNDATIDLADIKDNMHILDAGCGTGMVSIYICKKFKNLKSTCIVNTQELYDKTKNNIKKHCLQKRMNVYLMDFDYLKEPIINNKYDRILFLESIDYTKNRLKLIKECYELLNKGGKLFIKTPQFKNNIDKKNYEDIKNLIYTWEYNFSTISSILNDFRQTYFTNVNYILLNPLKSLIFNNPSDLFKLIKFLIKNNQSFKQENFVLLFYGSYNYILASK
jgi:ubiquinone/menaquinone biosynthesis C-methylase UbiE